MEKGFIRFPTKIFTWEDGSKIDSLEMDSTSMQMVRNIKANS
jgi:hypothetical protein